MPRPISASRNIRTAGMAAGSIALLIILGCMSIEIGSRKDDAGCTTAEGTLIQTGCAMVAENTTQCVYYPIPYVAPPNLEITCTFDDCTVTAQETDHFCVQNSNALCRKVKWKARGVRLTPVLPPPPPVPTTPPVKTEMAPSPTPTQ